MKRLENKKAIITGGTRGIGLAIARSYIKNGADVALVGVNQERGLKICQELESEKVRGDQSIEFYQVNVSSHEAVNQFAKDIQEKWGKVDIIVNSAGVTRDQLVVKIKEEDWDTVLDTNLKSVYNFAHAFLRGMMKNRSGRIINISSVIGIMGNPGQSNYAASKAGMIGLTKSLAKEVASRNITINCIAPGFIQTDMTDQLNEEQKTAILSRVPMKRLGEGIDIANAAVYLASDESSYMTGQVLTIDGGLTA